jgi:glycosyltransferase involved in cell wall biosynthesis
VTPSYNQGAFIEETIRSVLLQGYPNLEYIVVDGGSTDNTPPILRRYERWLGRSISEPDNGQADAINKGFRLTSGSILAWLNSDDCYTKGALGHVAAYFSLRPAANVVAGFRRTAHEASAKRNSLRVYLTPDAYSLSRCCYIAQESTFWRRSLWDTVGGLDESYRFALDYDLWQRILNAGFEFHLLPKFLGVFRIHPDSKGSRWTAIRDQELARIYQKYLGTTKSELELWSEISPKWWRRVALLHALGRRGLLDALPLARALVRALSLHGDDIKNATRQPVRFAFE